MNTDAISKTYLQDSPQSDAEPHILIGRFDAKSGLVAGFQSSSGKRILFRARLSSSGAVIAQALHYDPSIGKIHNLVERSRSVDAKGVPLKSIIVGGIDLASLLRGARDKNDTYLAQKERALQFLAQAEGKALLEGIPALYAALDGVAEDSSAQQLKQPFGAIAMGLQLGTNHYSGLEITRRTISAEKLAAMSADCFGEKECVYSGKDFSIYRSGLFDAISKRSLSIKRIAAASDLPHLATSPDRSILSQENSQLPQLNISSTSVHLKHGDGNCTNAGPCFGYCGPGCIAPGMVATVECLGHDLCVCKYGHAACVNSVPADCSGSIVQCYNLIDAALSWVGGIWDILMDFWDWIMSWFDQDPEDPSDPVLVEVCFAKHEFALVNALYKFCCLNPSFVHRCATAAIIGWLWRDENRRGEFCAGYSCEWYRQQWRQVEGDARADHRKPNKPTSNECVSS
ncbi:MAG: hypothetical protein HC782_01405 [Gammaproteobacteria bacterium]|nr:hypothetical protein [Gammaproteobacteria bacterium]